MRLQTSARSNQVRWASEEQWGKKVKRLSVCPPCLSRFGSMRSSQVGGRGEERYMDDPTGRVGSARERDVQVDGHTDGWMDGGRTARRALWASPWSCCTTHLAPLSLSVSLPPSLYPPPSTPNAPRDDTRGPNQRDPRLH